MEFLKEKYGHRAVGADEAAALMAAAHTEHECASLQPVPGWRPLSKFIATPGCPVHLLRQMLFKNSLCFDLPRLLCLGHIGVLWRFIAPLQASDQAGHMRPVLLTGP